MAIRKKQVESQEPTEDTRAFAAWWLQKLQSACNAARVSFTVPWQRQNELGEVVFEWHLQQPPKKLLRVFIEGSEATYQRLWGGEDGRKYYADGECTQTDMARLLIEWLGY